MRTCPKCHLCRRGAYSPCYYARAIGHANRNPNGNLHALASADIYANLHAYGDTNADGHPHRRTLQHSDTASNEHRNPNPVA